MWQGKQQSAQTKNVRELRKMKGNRKYKDSVFCDYMSDGPKLVELYNAVYGTNYPSDTPVEINTLDNVLYMDRVNDISFTLDGKFVVLLEQQSTLNENIPLRMGIYVMRLYEKLLHSNNLYRRRRIPLFTPQFIMLYNGGEEEPEHTVEYLSDAFVEKLEHPPMELEVEVFNISRNGAHVPELLKRCKSLGDYSLLVELIEGYRQQGKDVGEAIRLAIQDCVRRGVMQDYLEAKGSEVQNMIFTEWNWEDAFHVWKEEEYAAGLEQGKLEGKREGELEERIASIQKLIKTLHLSADEAMEALEILPEEREQYQKLLDEQKH